MQVRPLVEGLHRRQPGGCSRPVRRRITGGAAVPLSLADGAGCSAGGFRPGAAHAVPRSLPAVPRRSTFQSPRSRDRRPGSVADESASDGPDRAEHHGAGHCAQCRVARALRHHGGGHQHQKQCGYTVDLDHICTPTIKGGMLPRFCGEMRDALWPEHGLLGSAIPVRKAYLRSLRRGPAPPRCGWLKCWPCRPPWCRP